MSPGKNNMVEGSASTELPPQGSQVARGAWENQAERKGQEQAVPFKGRLDWPYILQPGPAPSNPFGCDENNTHSKPHLQPLVH